jgi:hypothetical protein
MSKSALTNHNFGSVTIGGGGNIIPNVINVTSNTILTTKQSGCLVICSHTASTCRITLPLHPGVSFNFVQNLPGNYVVVFPADNTQLYGSIVSGTTGSIYQSSGVNDMEFGSQSVVGDRFQIICDGSKFYFNGNCKNENGIMTNDW